MAAVPPSYASASLYVGDLFNEVTEALLFEIFNAVGPVASVRVCRDAATRRSLGYAYVNFHRLEDAERALDTMNFKNIRNRPCRIMWSHRDPSLRKSGLGNIFVKNLAPSIDNKSLYDTFSMFGNILSCKVSTNSKRESLGYGFVHYESEEAAQAAILRVDGKVIAGQQVVVQTFRSKKDRGVDASTTFTNVYVKNIPEEVEEAEIAELFAPFGKITSKKLVVDDQGKSKGFAFINFDSAEEGQAAVEALNGHEMQGKKIYVGRAQRKEEREKELRDKYDSIKAERQKKYEGVNLYVKNLGDETDEEKLREAFKVCGNITSCKIMTDSAGKSKGFGFVCFATPEEANKAVTDLTGCMLDSKPLYVSLAQRKEDRRVQLQMQHGQRGKGMGNMPAPNMYPPQGGPVFYAPGAPAGMNPRNFMYQQQMMPRQRWQGQPGGQPQQMMVPGGRGGPGGVNYQLMPVPNGRNPQSPATGNQPGQPRQGRQGRRNQGQNQGGQGGQMQGGGPRRSQQGQQQQMQQGGQFPGGQQQATPEPASAVTTELSPEALTIKLLAAAPEEQQKQMIGERLFPLIKHSEPVRAGKITGMLLEMDNGELIHLLENVEARNEKISEAIAVLDSAGETA